MAMSDIVRPELATWRPASPRRTGPAIHRHVRLLDAQRDQRIGCRGCCGWGSTWAGRSPTCSCTTPTTGRSGCQDRDDHRRPVASASSRASRQICRQAGSGPRSWARSCTARPPPPTRCSRAVARGSASRQRGLPSPLPPRGGVDARAAVRLHGLRPPGAARRRRPHGRGARPPGRRRRGGRAARRGRASRRRCAELVTKGVEAITVCLLNSYANPAHEQAVARVAEGIVGDVPIFLSSDVLAEFREYERAITTTMNAYVAPEMERYLSGLRRGLDAVRAGAELQVVRSDGGLMSLDAARATPVHTILSGPAGGVSGAAHSCASARASTASSPSTWAAPRPTVGQPRRPPADHARDDASASSPCAPRRSRSRPSAPAAARSPTSSDVTGGLRVGPQSAGATPGPACYGHGGPEATVTDANVVLGHLPPRLLGGAMDARRRCGARGGRARRRRARARTSTQPAGHRATSSTRTCSARCAWSPSSSGCRPTRLRARPLRRRGRPARERPGGDPRLLPGDRAAGARRPLGAGLPRLRRAQRVQPDVHPPVADVRPGEVAERLAALGEQAAAFLSARASRRRPRDLATSRTCATTARATSCRSTSATWRRRRSPALGDAFDATHQRLYGFGLPGGAELVTLRAVGIGSVPSIETPAATAGAGRRLGRAGRHAPGLGRRSVPRGRRPTTAPGSRRHVVDGPAIVEQYDATTIVLEGHVATVDHARQPADQPQEAA